MKQDYFDVVPQLRIRINNPRVIYFSSLWKLNLERHVAKLSLIESCGEGISKKNLSGTIAESFYLVVLNT